MCEKPATVRGEPGYENSIMGPTQFRESDAHLGVVRELHAIEQKTAPIGKGVLEDATKAFTQRAVGAVVGRNQKARQENGVQPKRIGTLLPVVRGEPGCVDTSFDSVPIQHRELRAHVAVLCELHQIAAATGTDAGQDFVLDTSDYFDERAKAIVADRNRRAGPQPEGERWF